MGKRKLPEKVKDFFNIVLQDPYRKSITRIICEYGRFLFTSRSITEQYFSKFLYRKGVSNFEDYVMTHKLRDKCWTLNHPDYNSIMDNKYLFEVFFKKHNIRVTTSFAYNINSLFFIDNDFEQINTKEEFLEFIRTIAKKSLQSENIFIKKNTGSGGGKQIFRVSYKSLKDNEQELERIFSIVRGADFVFQEEVIQHEEISRLNSYCVNTLRIETFTNSDNVSRIMSGILRIGFNKSFIDNVSKGGAYVGIDFRAGKLRAEAVSDFTNGRARTYLEHPETKLRFEGYNLPFFEEIVALVISASQCIPQVKVIGWDVAITPDGPLLIEGNELPGLMSSDIGQKGLGNNPVFLDLQKEVTELG